MPVTPTYPGVYIEELPSSSHTITPAPTSIAAFVGYTHPLKTSRPNAAIQLFSFADYRANFGGFFDSPWLPDYVGDAVFQFFLNGGSTAYVVGLTDAQFVGATATLPTSMPVTLVAREPAGVEDTSSPPAITGTLMQVTVSNVSADGKAADIVISFGNRVETYRKVGIAEIATRLGTADAPVSSLVTVDAAAAAPTATYTATTSPAAQSRTVTFVYASAPQANYNPIVFSDIEAAFDEYQPLDKVPIFNLLVIPGITDVNVMSEGVAYAERKRAFYIMDPPSDWDVDTQPGGGSATKKSPIEQLDTLPVPVSTNAAIYYPWLKTTDPVSNAQTISPPSGFVAGVYAKEDSARGVWKSPAGLETALNGTLGVVDSGVMTDNQQGSLNGFGINCLRQFPSLPPVVYGARTLAYRNSSLKDQWGYVAVRRMALFLEQSLYANLTWAVFEPNDTPLWNALTQEVSAFMLGLFRQRAFAGSTPRQAFLVQCDSTTTTQADVNNGRVNILVGFAPLKPAEFVIVQIAQLAGQDAS